MSSPDALGDGTMRQDQSRGKGKEDTLWVCDRCFKYLKTLSGYTAHTVSRTLGVILTITDRYITGNLSLSRATREKGVRKGQLYNMGDRGQ